MTFFSLLGFSLLGLILIVFGGSFLFAFQDTISYVLCALIVFSICLGIGKLGAATIMALISVLNK